MVITELGVFELQDGEMVLTEIGNSHSRNKQNHDEGLFTTNIMSPLDPDTSLDAVRVAAGMDFKVSDSLKKMAQL